jgi:hypothetical protein
MARVYASPWCAAAAVLIGAGILWAMCAHFE